VINDMVEKVRGLGPLTLRTPVPEMPAEEVTV